MIQRIRELSSRRRRVARRIQARKAAICARHEHLREKANEYLGTPQSLVHGFLAGFLMDQSRALVPNGPTPLSIALPWLIRFLR